MVFHPSSGVHNAVSTVSGINETVTATCRERGWAGGPATFTIGSSTGLNNARYCRYNFNVVLTVHLSIILAINQLNT